MSKGAIQAGVAIDIARQLESALEARGAAGKGLHEKVSSIEGDLPEALVTKLRFIASVRNKIVHEDDLLPEKDMAVFVESGVQAVEALGAAVAKGKPAKRRSQAKAGKTTPRQAPTTQNRTPAQTRAIFLLGGALVLAGIVWVFLLVVLGNDGSALWIGAFSTYFLLGCYFLKKLRRASAEVADETRRGKGR